ncbi:hypothetical protein HY310_03755 [Candidatus Microgenomates bacterium]|nr:hypothetical protein [Candidatus Microgenomates bacterium]
MASSTSSGTKKKEYIILDTCIFQYLGDKNKSKTIALKNCLDSLVTDGYALALSEISIYENFLLPQHSLVVYITTKNMTGLILEIKLLPLQRLNKPDLY